LWANHRDQFEQDWYWSNETNADYPAFAWYQDFGNGIQLDYRKGDGTCRARAVRRSPI
jgi:hypothetical protein